MDSPEIKENPCLEKSCRGGGFSISLVHYVGEETNSYRSCRPHLRRSPTLTVWPERKKKTTRAFCIMFQLKKKMRDERILRSAELRITEEEDSCRRRLKILEKRPSAAIAMEEEERPLLVFVFGCRNRTKKKKKVGQGSATVPGWFQVRFDLTRLRSPSA